MKDSIVINILPSRVTAHRGMLSKKPTSSIAVMIVSGSTVSVAVPTPTVVMIVLVIPCTMSKIANMNSMPYTTRPRAMAKRMNNFAACSGLLMS